MVNVVRTMCLPSPGKPCKPTDRPMAGGEDAGDEAPATTTGSC